MRGFAATSSNPWSLVLLCVSGFLELSFYAMTQTLVHLIAPPAVRGRLIGLFSMSAFGLRAFSGVTVGVAGALIGVHRSLALSAMALFAVTVALFAFAAAHRERGDTTPTPRCDISSTRFHTGIQSEK